MKLHELAPPNGARSERRRLGRGLGSGRGKTAGKGTKGQKARSGGGVPLYFEGGQLPLVRRLPYRRGFTNIFRVEFEVVNLDQLEELDAGTTVTAAALAQRGVIRKATKPLKVLGRGSLTKALTVQANAFSRSAEEAIEKAGGKAEVMPHAELRPPPEKTGSKREARRRAAREAASRSDGAPRAAAESTEQDAAPTEAKASESAASEATASQATATEVEENPA
jgi:large subunit ribosomal protein L15